MKLTSRHAGVIIAIATVIMYLAVAVIYQTQGYVLKLGIIPVVVLCFAAVFVAWIGWRLRRMVNRGDDIDGVGATRTLVASQTVAIVGSISLGAVIAIILNLIQHLDSPRGTEEFIYHLIILVAPLLAIAAGFFGQWCCQVPPDDSSDQTT